MAEVQSLLVPNGGFQVPNGYKQKSSYCGFQSEVTVITGYGSTQDDEHLCSKRVTEPVLGYKCSKKSTTTTVHVLIRST